MTEQLAQPIVAKESPYDVKETADRLEKLLQSKGIPLFGRIDHARAAAEFGLTMDDCELLVFGDPKVGTYLMQECPEIAIELPLKILIWHADKTWVGYREPGELISRYNIVEHRFTVKKLSAQLAALVSEAVK